MRNTVVLLILLLLGIPCYAYELPKSFLETSLPSLSEYNPDQDGEHQYPKVALVLSGGAAKGFAHVGVIRVLEEAGIPIDLVIGVSMGGLVGSLYAAGYSPRDMEQMSEAIDWMNVFTTPRGGSPYLMNPVLQSRQNILSIYFDSQGIGRSLGVLPDQKIVSQMSRITYRVSHIRDYDQFQIPLRVVGADLFTGELVLFNNIPLHAAMRSTMAIPGLFSPYYVGGRYYLDGGVVNNMPVSLAKLMGADVIISVDVMNELNDSIDDFTSPMSVVTQAALLAIANTFLDESRFSDLHFQIRSSNYNALEFWRYKDFFLIGEDLAREQMDEITALADYISGYRPLEYRDPERRGDYFSLPLPRVTGVEIDPSLNVDDFPLELFDSLIERSLNTARIESTADRLVSAGSYESIGYGLRTDNGDAVLSLYPIPVSRGKHYLGATFLFDGSYASGSDDHYKIYPGFSVDLSFSDLVGIGSYLAVHIELMENLRSSVEMTIPLTPALFIRPHISLGERGLVSADAGEDSTAAFFTVGQEFGLQLRPSMRFGAGVNLSNTWYTVGGEIQDDLQLLFSPRIDIRNYEPSRFPQQGMLAQGQLDLPFGSSESWYNRIDLSFRHYLPLYKEGTLGYDLHFGSYTGEQDWSWNQFDLGGWDGVPGYVPRKTVHRDMIRSGVCFYHRFSAISGILGMDVFAVGQVRAGIGWSDDTSSFENPDYYGGIGAGIGINSVLGELVFSGGVNYRGDWAVYILLN